MSDARIAELCAGVGGIGLGLERAGLGRVSWQAEIAEFPRKLLALRFPDADLHGDITADDFVPPPVDLLCAGFPCQPFSQAGRQQGLADARWLWPSIARIVEHARPARIVLENVPDLCRMGLVPVLADLARLGYDAQWDVVPAVAVGAPHLRFRFLMVAYLPDDRLRDRRVFAEAPVPADYWRATPEPLPRLLPLSENRKGHPQRLTALGNSVVPQLFAWLGWRIQASEEPLELTPQLFPVAPDDLNAGPKSGALVDGQVHELPRSCPDRKTNGEVWPTPAAREDGWPLETLLSMRRADGSPPQRWDERLYHPTTGQIVQRGLRNVVEGAEAGLWPTPLVSSTRAGRGSLVSTHWSTPGLEQAAELADGVLPREYEHPDEIQGEWGDRYRQAAEDRVWPTPQASDGTGGRVETGALDRADDPNARTLTRPSGAKAALSLRTAVEQNDRMWPTPTASDQNVYGADDERRSEEHPEGRPLRDVASAAEQERLWPTPDTVNRKSRRAMTSSAAGEGNGRRSGGGSSSPPGLAQAAELVPRELQDIPPDDLPPAAREYWPTPTANDGKNATVMESQAERNSPGLAATIAGRDLVPTPTASDGRGPKGSGYVERRGNDDLARVARRIDVEQDRDREMFPTPAAADGDRGPDYARLNREGAGGDDLVTQQHRQAISDGKLERGSSGALNPEWVEYLMGYPASYTDPADPRTADQFDA